MQTRSSQKRSTESSARLVAHLQPRSADDRHAEPLLPSGVNFSHVDLFSHAPKRGPVQMKLTVGAPNDQYEQEADRVAEQVVSMPDSAVQPAIQRETIEDEELQAKPIATTITPLVQRSDSDSEEDEDLQTKPSVQRQEGEDEDLQAKPIGQSLQRLDSDADDNDLQMKSAAPVNAPTVAPDRVADRIESSKGGGSPLPADVRAFVEPRFGVDFSQVRVHTGSESEQLNRAVGARAFTQGQDVFYGAGNSPSDLALTAHELTHVVQQSSQPVHSPLRQPASNSLGTTRAIQCDPPKDASLEAGAKSLDLGQLDSNAKKLVNGAAKLNTIAQKLREKGKAGLFDDEKMLKNAQQLTDLSKALSNVATGLTNLAGSAAGATLKKGDDLFDKANKLVNIANAIGSAIEAEKALDDLEAHPHDYDKAKKWAVSVGDVFDSSNKLIDLIPDGVLPGFIREYWKGLLSAPKNYIDAFITIMEIRYKKIDAEAGISGKTRRATQGDKVMWEGDLTGVYSAAFFVQPMGQLDQFMTAHRKIEGVDLWKTTIPIGKALLVNALEREFPLSADPSARPDPRRAWIPWMQGQ